MNQERFKPLHKLIIALIDEGVRLVQGEIEILRFEN